MPATDAATTNLLHVTASGVSVVVDATGDGVPRILYWGAPLGSDLEPAALTAAVDRPAGRASLDEQPALSLLPDPAGGWSAYPALTGVGAGRGWPRFRLADVEQDGNAITVKCLDEIAGLELRGALQLGPTGVLQLRLTLRNIGHAPYELHQLGAALPLPAHVGDLVTFTGRWGREFIPHRGPWLGGAVTRENRRGRTSHDSFPAMIAGTPSFTETTGEVYGVHVAWSGNHVLRAERLADGRGVISGGELLGPGEITLAPGDDYSTPWLYAAYSAAGLNGMSAALHEHVRRQQARLRGDRPRPVLINTWEAVYFEHDLNRLTELARRAAAVGVERFVLDDGWFLGRRNDRAGLGDWVVDRAVYPDGLDPLVTCVRELGMEFGIWVEPEMVNEDSELFRAHPDWIIGDPAEPPPTGRNQHVLDLSRAEVSGYLLDRLDALLTDLPVAYVKWDMNRDVVPGAHVAPVGVHRQTVALYALLDELRRRHPTVEFESCSSGGGRADYEILDRTTRIWTSDCNDPLDRQEIQRGFGYFFPPSVMGAHVGPPRAHTTGRTHSLSFRAASAIFGHFGIEWDITSASAEELNELSNVVGLHKKLRPLLHSGRVVRVDQPDPAAIVHGVVAADAREAVFAYVQLRSGDLTTPLPLRPVGLAVDAGYTAQPILGINDLPPATQLPRWLAGGDVHLTGRQLMAHGLTLPVMLPETALLVHLVAG